MMIRSALQALRSTKAVSAAEYAILAVGVVVVVGAGVASFKTTIQTALTKIGTTITSNTGS